MLQTAANFERAPWAGSYATLRDRARQALDRAEYKKAEKLFEWAYVEATRRRDPALQERAYCNLTVAAHATGSAERYLAGIRAILGTGTDRMARFLAAYNLAFVFEHHTARRKARFYAQVACQQAAALDDTLPAAAAAYNLGRLWLGESRLERAQRSIETSIELLDERSDALNHALETSTLGYCLALMGQKRRALALLEASVAAITRAGYRLYEPAVHLNFGFALLEMADFERAHHHAERALEVPCDRPDRKHALYLSGEAASILGRRVTARERFGQLQDEFYPQIPNLADELAANPTYGFICWLA